MNEVKALLKELQAADLEHRQLTVKRDAIPSEIADLKKGIDDIRKGFEALKTQLTESRKEQKLAELSLASQEEALARYNSQLYSAKTNEEYKAFLKEIETAERRKSEVEDRIIEIMERIESEEAEIAREEGAHKEAIAQKEAAIAQTEQSREGIEERLTVLADKRERLRAEIPKDTLSVYDHIATGKGHLAVAQVMEDNRCSACLNPIPAQEAIETLHSERLLLCQYCGRILVG